MLDSGGVKMGKRTWLTVLIIIVILGAGWLWQFARQTPNDNGRAATGVTVGMPAPQFKVVSLSGREVQTSFTEKITVMNFWATWCPPCREEMPELDKFAAEKQSEVAFLAINVQESAERVAAFIKQNSYSMPVYLDSGTAAGMYKVTAIPTTIIIDRQGIIKFRKAGGVTKSELEGVLRGL